MVVVYDFIYMVLCYFNVVGVDFRGWMGQLMFGVMYFIKVVSQVVIGLCEKIDVFGIDYLIFDGICVCDYIYVIDLVNVYFKVLQCM